MKNLFVIILFFVGGISLNAQWDPVNSNTTENLYDIVFLDSLTGYCVGGSDDLGSPQSTGVILKSIDGGENWTTIFSKDSMVIKSIAIVEENGDIKLYAFALKNGSTYSASTFLNTPIQNWLILPITYYPTNLKIYDDVVYFIDELDSNKLKSFSGDSLTTLSDASLSFFDVNNSGIIYLDQAVANIQHSSNFVSPFDTINPHSYYSQFGQNQSLYAHVKKIGDTIILKGTYASVVVYTLDNGESWFYNYGGGAKESIILNSGVIYSLNSNGSKIIYSNDLGISWAEDEIPTDSELRNFYFYNENIGFVFGDNGVIYKTTNGGGIVATKDLEDPKKKIKIFPNPTKDFLHIEGYGGLKATLINSKGNIIKRINHATRNIDVSNIPSGLYFVRIETEKGITIEKIIIE